MKNLVYESAQAIVQTLQTERSINVLACVLFLEEREPASKPHSKMERFCQIS